MLMFEEAGEKWDAPKLNFQYLNGSSVTGVNSGSLSVLCTSS